MWNCVQCCRTMGGSHSTSNSISISAMANVQVADSRFGNRFCVVHLTNASDSDSIASSGSGQRLAAPTTETRKRSLEVFQVIGRGGFGNVHIAKFNDSTKSTTTDVAVKVCINYHPQ